MLDNAYSMAAHAVDSKPESAFAQYALSAILLAKGDVARAKIVSDKSYRLNPDDGAVAFGHATTLILTGDTDAGLALLDKNAIRSPNNWIGYHLVKALGYYLKDDLTTAAAESRQIANPFFPPGLMLDALIADRVGDRARATVHRHALSILSGLARPIPRQCRPVFARDRDGRPYRCRLQGRCRGH